MCSHCLKEALAFLSFPKQCALVGRARKSAEFGRRPAFQFQLFVASSWLCALNLCEPYFSYL